MPSDSAFRRPTLDKLIRRARSDIKTRLPGADANLRASPEEVLAIASAGLTHGTHGHIKWLSRQVLADLCEDEFLVRLASIYAVNRIDAVASTGEVTITGVNTSVCPAGTVWVRGDGVQYTQDDEATISGGQAIIAVTAVEAGTDGDAVVGTVLQIESAETGITSSATVSGDGIVDGAEIESILALRERLLSRLRTPPQGGGPGDYEAWALEVTGVTRAWEVALLLGPGTVGVYFVRDGDVSIFPSAGEVTDVQTYIDSVRPVTADVTVIAPTEVPLDFTFTLLEPDTAEVRAAVSAELEALLYDSADPSTTVEIELSRINEACSIATGETDHIMTVPASNPTAVVGEILTLGTITWPA